MSHEQCKRHWSNKKKKKKGKNTKLLAIQMGLCSVCNLGSEPLFVFSKMVDVPKGVAKSTQTHLPSKPTNLNETQTHPIINWVKWVLTQLTLMFIGF